jgi:hypothetical protein
MWRESGLAALVTSAFANGRVANLLFGRDTAEQVRVHISERPRADIGFLLRQAARCRGLAAGLDDDAMKADLLALAADLEKTATREGGD